MPQNSQYFRWGRYGEGPCSEGAGAVRGRDCASRRDCARLTAPLLLRRTTKYVITGANGKSATTTMCPGATYQVQVRPDREVASTAAGGCQ